MWKSLICGLVCLLVVVVSVVIWRLGGVIGQVATDADTAIKHIDAAVQKVGTAADNLGGVISAERDAQKRQLVEANKLIAATKEVIVRTDLALTGHDGLIPNANHGIKVITLDAHDTMLTANASLEASTQAITKLNERVADPRIDTILSELSVSSLHFDQASANIAGTTGDLKDVADFYKHKIMTPLGFWKTVAVGAEHLIVPATNIAIAVK